MFSDRLLIEIATNSRGQADLDLARQQLVLYPAEELEAIAPVLGKLKNQIQVHGHTDARPFPAAAGRTNWELSFDRANNARRTLESHGIREGQLAGVFAHGSVSLYVRDSPLDPRNRRLAILAVRRGAEEFAAKGVPVKTIQKTAVTAVPHSNKVPPAL